MIAMAKTSAKVLLSSLLILFLCPLFGSSGHSAIPAGEESAAKVLEGAQREGQVVWYTTTGLEIAHKMVAKFRERYPKIEPKIYRANDAPLMERILGEDRAGRYVWDVMTTTGYYIRVLKQKGMLETYDSPQRKYYREGYKDPENTWTSYYTNYAVFGYNTKTVPKNSMPKSYTDLLNPFWKNQIVIGARTYEWFATVVDTMGEKNGLAYMRQLAQQNPQLRQGRTLLGQLVVAGEFKVALSAYTGTYDRLKKAGAPVDWVFPDHVFAILHPLAISSRAPHPNAAKVFLDFVLSRTGQEIIVPDFYTPDRVDMLSMTPGLEKIKPIFAAEKIYQDFDRYMKLFEEVFMRR